MFRNLGTFRYLSSTIKNDFVIFEQFERSAVLVVSRKVSMHMHQTVLFGFPKYPYWFH
jgi:hypothetical protein